MLAAVNWSSQQTGLYLNVEKTNELHINADGNAPIRIGGTDVKRVEHFNLLGSMIDADGSCRQEITRRIAVDANAASEHDKIWGATAFGRPRNDSL